MDAFSGISNLNAHQRGIKWRNYPYYCVNGYKVWGINTSTAASPLGPHLTFPFFVRKQASSHPKDSPQWLHNKRNTQKSDRHNHNPRCLHKDRGIGQNHLNSSAHCTVRAFGYDPKTFKAKRWGEQIVRTNPVTFRLFLSKITPDDTPNQQFSALHPKLYSWPKKTAKIIFFFWKQIQVTQTFDSWDYASGPGKI